MSDAASKDMATDEAPAKLIWATSDRLRLKLHAGGAVKMNKEYETATSMPDDLTILDEDGDIIENSSFASIIKDYSIRFNDTSYLFKEAVPEHPSRQQDGKLRCCSRILVFTVNYLLF
jgi:hypothetical protein